MFFNPVEPLTQQEIDWEYDDVIEKPEPLPVSELKAEIIDRFKATIPDKCPIPSKYSNGKNVLLGDVRLYFWIGEHISWNVIDHVSKEAQQWYEDHNKAFLAHLSDSDQNDFDFSFDEKIEGVCIEKWNLEW